MAPVASAPAAKVAPGLARLPLSFEENDGQLGADVRFLARQGGLMLAARDRDVALGLHRQGAAPVVLRMRVHDGVMAHPTATDELAGRVNYFIGSDPSRWRTDVRTFGAVAYRNVRRGVDLVLHGSSQGRLEYDLVVAPGASPDVAIDVDGAAGLSLTSDGALSIAVAGGSMRQEPPMIYQVVDGKRRVVAGRYRILDRSRVGFVVAAYDRARPLVIDPVLQYSTYLGGSGVDRPTGIAIDSAGSVYITGSTNSTDFPIAGGYQSTPNGVFITKLTPAGDALVYSTYFSADQGGGIAVDDTGAVYFTGATATQTNSLPTVNAFQPTPGGGGNDAFVAKLAPAGNALVYSTYFGGGDIDIGGGIAVDASGAAYITGITRSGNLPLAHPIQATFGGLPWDVYVAKLAPAGNALVYSTFLGGKSDDEAAAIAVDATGAAYVCGGTSSSDFPVAHPFQPTLRDYDAFVTKLTAAGDAWAYSTYLGGRVMDRCYGIAVDAAGVATVAGSASADFPVTNVLAGSCASFVTRLNVGGDTVGYSTCFGGSGNDYTTAVAVDASGAAYVAGITSSTDFPVVAAFQTANAGGSYDAFAAMVSPDGSALAYSTYLGGAGTEGQPFVAVNGAGEAWLAGETYSTNFPTVNPLQPASHGPSDAFVARLGSAALAIAPSATTTTLPPRAKKKLLGYGGSNAGYSWSLTTNASGGTIDAATGVYTAGATSGVTDVAQLADSAGHVATATLKIGAGVTLSPSTAALPPRGQQQLSASGGAGGYVYSLATNASGATIDASSGAYVAGTVGGVTDLVQATDSLGNVATASVDVGASLAITPDSATAGPGDAIAFGGAGGSGSGYAWSLDENPSGATIDAATGAYVAGAAAGTDRVRLTDSLGNVATATVIVSVPAPMGNVTGRHHGCAVGGDDAGARLGCVVLLAALLLGARRRRARRARLH